MNEDPEVTYLAGDDNARVGPAERAELDKLREVLADPAVWVEPRADLQEQIVAAIADSKTHRRSRAIRYAIVGSAAAVVLTIGLAIGFNAVHGSQPVEYSASLRGTELAPRASGEVTLTKTESGWKIQLHATGLPRRGNGEFYEAWLKNDEGVLVPVGTFNQPNEVILWAGVPPTSHPTFTITRQLANGDPASTGEVVLSGAAQRAN
ncbi:MAG TPA: anti-sigma factor [Actinomycetes bacterium]|nr:anti-sigma factor [Actinomycetes bacterium]